MLFLLFSLGQVWYTVPVKGGICMETQFSRTERMFGEEGQKALLNARVAVFGAGGVGGYTIEALARAGVGAIDIIDHDTVSVSNINRQIIATHDTVGMQKTEAFRQRIASIHPGCVVRTYDVFFVPETADQFDFTQYDYVVDAIDTVSGKIELVLRAQAAGVPIICSMGTGNKIDPTRLEVADIYKTSVCPLARVMRTELRKRGVKKLKVLFSTEQPLPLRQPAEPQNGKVAPASNSFVPACAGLIIAGEVIKGLLPEGTV